MQPPAAASFFPTATELSSGVQWFKDHPVLAAAAATAVSVITYLNALDVAAAADDDSAPPPTASTTAVAFCARQKRHAPVRRSGATGSSGGGGKLSAAVSWCDEHGGSLTQVFEDDAPSALVRREARVGDSDSDVQDDDDDDNDAAQDEGQGPGAPPSGLRKSVTAQLLAAVGDAGALASESDADAVQTESPQWGWYVPITPPQDQFHVGLAEDNAPARALVVVEQSTSGDVCTMRRNVSGHMS
ncbi:unnamed protein product [Hyaloperonospora brassicae]|uniref:Uncharacterized protein n=1 Tax=Hyaloperonospora brassicae TaxID=162125 RepID=A0AAV0U0F4_HYABA|nr:unnamed protein product [Hyaloperonospora brassicae]